jgi:xanthine dehydrogenase accessory factor
MGCPGVIDVLLEKLPPGETPLGRFLDRYAEGMPAARGVRLDLAREGVLRDIVYIPGRSPLGSLGTPELDAAFIATAQQRLGLARAPEGLRLTQLPGSAEVFAWIVPAEAECVIFGATDDAQPLSQIAQEIGFKVRLIDPRPHLATPERFPQAEVRALSLQEYPRFQDLGEHSYVVVMGHQVERDLAALSLALRAPVPYIGLLSSQGRRESMLGHLRGDGTLGDEDPPVLRAPAGLWIGARTPEEIALSIVAEICSVRRQAAR